MLTMLTMLVMVAMLAMLAMLTMLTMQAMQTFQTQVWIPAIVGVAFVMGCNSASSSKADPSSVDSVAAQSTSVPVVDPPKRVVAEDTDVEHLSSQLKCTSKPSGSNKTACEILDSFRKGVAWDLTTIRGDEARYFGKAVAFSNGKAEEKWAFMVVRKTALNLVSPGDLPLRVIIRDLDKNLAAENTHAQKLWALLKRDDTVTRRNATANHVLSYAPATWDSASPTNGVSILVHASDGAFVRQGSDRALQIVQLDAARPGESGFSGTLLTLLPLLW